MRRTLTSVATFFLAAVLTVFFAGCAAPPTQHPGQPVPLPQARKPYRMLHLGEQFETAKGQVFVVRIQDEFKLIRCVPDGPIAGCYEDLLAVSDDSLQWSKWVDVEMVPGLKVAFVSPVEVAIHLDEPPPEKSE